MTPTTSPSSTVRSEDGTAIAYRKRGPPRVPVKPKAIAPVAAESAAR